MELRVRGSSLRDVVIHLLTRDTFAIVGEKCVSCTIHMGGVYACAVMHGCITQDFLGILWLQTQKTVSFIPISIDVRYADPLTLIKDKLAQYEIVIH